MKYAIVIPSGAADVPIDELDARTPLQAAPTPHIDWISVHGRQGRLRAIPESLDPTPDAALLSLLGYDPEPSPIGLGPIEAAARAIRIPPDALAFRCNLVTVDDGRLHDPTAGQVSPAEASRLIADLDEGLAPLGARFFPGQGHRNLMILADARRERIKCTPAPAVVAEPIAHHLPTGDGAKRLIAVMERARALLAAHEVNVVRRDLGENPVSDIWPWGPGGAPTLTSFEQQTGLRAAMIAGTDLPRGLARLAGIRVVDVPGATGDIATDYVAKGAAAAAALDDADLVIVHVQAPEDASLRGHVQAKIDAIAHIDDHVVGPLRRRITEFPRWRIMVAIDHATPVEHPGLPADPTPFCIAGEALHTVLAMPLSEQTAKRSDLQIDPGHELMEYFLRV